MIVSKCCNAITKITGKIKKRTKCVACEKCLSENDTLSFVINPHDIVNNILQEKKCLSRRKKLMTDNKATCSQCGHNMNTKFATNVRGMNFYMCTDLECPNYGLVCARVEDLYI